MLHIPFTVMGNTNSEVLMNEPWEREIFAFYERSSDRYSNVADIGANIGIHSILMAQQGWNVRAYEPDPVHVVHLTENVRSHGAAVDIINAAVAKQYGNAEFIRVLGNTTANHIAGARSHYGPIERVRVRTVACKPVLEWADFVKMDVEGSEADIICETNRDNWNTLEMVLEIGSAHNAQRIFEHMESLCVPIWSERIGWKRARSVSDLPKRYLEGSAFIGHRSWN